MRTIARHKLVKKPAWLLVALVVAFVGVLSLVAVVRSATATTVAVDPLASTVIVGDSTTVDVVVLSVPDLYGIQLQIAFDPTKVQVLDADLGTSGVQIDPGTCPAPDFVVRNEVSNATGIISYTVTALNPSPACNGDGLVASVELDALAVGESAIHFSDLILANSNGEEIPTEKQDGTLTVIIPPPDPPILAPIGNADRDGNYTVLWSASPGATSYALEQDDSGSFTSPTEVYSGPGTSRAVSGMPPGTYYYRVNASNTSGTSGWSNTESVEVRVKAFLPLVLRNF